MTLVSNRPNLNKNQEFQVLLPDLECLVIYKVGGQLIRERA